MHTINLITRRIAALTIMVIAALTVIPFAAAWTNDGQFHLECLRDGEQMAIFKCTHDICIVCQKNGYTYPSNRCAGLQQSCGQRPQTDVEPPKITLKSPQEGAFYNSRAVPFEITTNEEATYYYMERGKEAKGYLRICQNCLSYNREISFDDGPRTLTIKATDSSGNSAYKEVSFSIDSKIPVIRDTTPANGKYTNGEFTVFYDEENLLKTTLFHKSNSGAWQSVQKTNCQKGLRQNCTIIVNNLPNGDVSYYFTIQDSATSVSSIEKTALVDTTIPVLTRVSPQNTPYSTTNVPFELQINEPVQLSYVDLYDTKAPKTICSDCKTHTSTQKLADGLHKILITATDPAGNKAESTVEFAVDSVVPKIRAIGPANKGYANGVFEIEYDEANVQKITLHYSQSAEKKAVKTNCESGLRKKCVFDLAAMGLPNLQQGTLTYYFTIEDLATSVQSNTYTVTVDTVKPQLNVIKPQPAAQAKRLVDLDIKTNEPVTLEYIDNSDKRPAYRTLCKNCDSYSRTVNFNDGQHNLIVRATDNAGNSKNATVSFVVDSKAPKIRKMLPAHRGYANGNFTITLEEENLQSVTLHYMESGSTIDKQATMPGSQCTISGRYKTCSFNVQLIKQGPLKYYFEANDIATGVQSKTFDVTVDTIKPEIKINKPDQATYPQRMVQFNISLGEQATLEYQDNGSRLTRLCSRCTKYVQSRSFGYGQHSILLRATDAAGNTNEKTLNFEVTGP